MNYEVILTRKENAQWRDTYAHSSKRVCNDCRHFLHSHRFCEKWDFISQPQATCAKFDRQGDA